MNATTSPEKRRSDGRKHDTGLEKPYRPKPADFRETYIRMGWDGLDEHYSTNWRVIRRWIEEDGREFLKVARAEYVRAQRMERRKRYVMGRTLRKIEAPAEIVVLSRGEAKRRRDAQKRAEASRFRRRYGVDGG